MLNYLLFMLLAGGTVCTVLNKRPNIVVIITDDQDATLGGMTPLKNVRQLIGEQGVTFTNSYTTSPVCCPSRASFLTGLHVHNHLARNNSAAGGCYGPTWKQFEAHTFATVLKDAGYNTFYAGKYLNQYGRIDEDLSTVPPGWSDWHGLFGNSNFYNYTLNNNGVPTFSADLYLTDVVRDLGVSFLEQQDETRPFLAVFAPPAPHAPFTPAPRHRDAYINVTAPRTPHFNFAAEDKHWLMTMPPVPLPESVMPELDRVFRARWETLLAVDELAADVIATLEKNNLSEDTYVIYTSDNGYHVGQFSQVYDKRQPYESDIRVPLLIKGPGVKRNVTSAQPVLNIDLAPTIIELAGLEVPTSMDGIALDLSVAGENIAIDRTILLEYFGEGIETSVDPSCPWTYDNANLAWCNLASDCKCQDSRNNTYTCLLHVGDNSNYKYCEFQDDQDFIEIYNLDNDPYELINVVDETLPALKYWYSHVLAHLQKCQGADCNIVY